MECRIRKNSVTDVDEMETEQALKKENNRKRKLEEIDSEEEHKNLLIKNDDVELSSDFEQTDLMSDDEDEPVDDQDLVNRISKDKCHLCSNQKNDEYMYAVKKSFVFFKRKH